MKTYKGYFRPKNPEKYKGNPQNIVYRSSWELKVMNKLDAHPDVIWWQSEETIIPYRSPVDGRMHRYFVDFTAKMKTADGKVKTILIEVKPAIQTKPPVLAEGKTKTRRYVNAVMTWGVNDAKWKAAREYCKDQGFEFVIMTEKEIGIKY